MRQAQYDHIKHHYNKTDDIQYWKHYNGAIIVQYSTVQYCDCANIIANSVFKAIDINHVFIYIHVYMYYR